MPRFARLTIVIGLMLVASLALPTVAGAKAKLRADYGFEGNFKSAVNGVPRLAKVGPGGKFGKAKVGPSKQGVWKWPEASGLRLNKAGKALGTNGGTYTFVMLVKLNKVDDYRKLIDFANLQSDNGWYVYERALTPYPLGESDPKINAGRFYQIAMTRGAGGTVRGYVNGKMVITDSDASEEEVLGAEKILRFLMDDITTTGEESGGAIARLRIWDNALSAKKIKNLRR